MLFSWGWINIQFDLHFASWSFECLTYVPSLQHRSRSNRNSFTKSVTECDIVFLLLMFASDLCVRRKGAYNAIAGPIVGNWAVRQRWGQRRWQAGQVSWAWLGRVTVALVVGERASGKSGRLLAILQTDGTLNTMQKLHLRVIKVKRKKNTRHKIHKGRIW